MRKNVAISMAFVIFLLCGCRERENTQTRFLLNTVATITASCQDGTIDGAFLLCEELEKKLSRTVKGSDVFNLNEAEDFVTVSEDTVKVIEKAIYYGDVSQGKFDITICPVSELWDFTNQIVPNKNEITEALKNVDYQSIEIKGSKINLNGKKIDLGGIAKGYIADQTISYLKEKGVKSAIVNLGGNVSVIGRFIVGIQKPFENTVAANIEIKDKSAVTSGIYQRYIEKDGRFYHHILDTKTGYGVENELASVTVIGESSVDCDALSTVCLLLGEEEGKKLIDSINNTEAVFIDKKGSISVTNGLYLSGDRIKYKNN